MDTRQDKSVVTPDRIVRLGYAYREAKTLLSAVELGVFTALAEGPLDLDTLRNKVAVDQRGARDFFDALVALDLLERDHAGRYANTPETALYLDRRKPTYLGGELEFINAQLYAQWNSLTAALKTGQPQSGAGAAGNYAVNRAHRYAGGERVIDLLLLHVSETLGDFSPPTVAGIARPKCQILLLGDCSVCVFIDTVDG
jgi:hypothetical protein